MPAGADHYAAPGQPAAAQSRGSTSTAASGRQTSTSSKSARGTVMGGKSVNMLIAELGCFGNQFTSFLDAEFVQSFDSTVVNRHGAPMLRLGDSFLESIAAGGWILV